MTTHTKKYVVDSSVMVKWLMTDSENYIDQAQKLLLDFRNGNVALFAPELSKYEVGNTLFRRGVHQQETMLSLQTFYRLPITYVSETYELAQQSLSLAMSLSITYYDASFLALAQKLSAIVITDNMKHLGKATDISVMPLATYS